MHNRIFNLKVISIKINPKSYNLLINKNINNNKIISQLKFLIKKKTIFQNNHFIKKN